MTRRPFVALALLAGAAALAGVAGPARAARPPKLTPERLHATPVLSGTPTTVLAWHPDGRRLTFLRRSGDKVALHALDVTRGAESVLLDPARLAGAGRDDAGALPLDSAAWLAGGRDLLVRAHGDLFTVDVASARTRRLTQTQAAEEFAQPSPDGSRAAFVRANDLYVVHLASGRETRLTRSGSETVLNGRLDWVYEEELGGRSGQAFAWAPDSRAIAYLQLDQGRVPTFPIVDFLPVRNDVFWQRYPQAGAPNAVVRVGVVGLERDGSAGPERTLAVEPEDSYVLPQLAWTQDSRGLAYQRLDRAQDQLELRVLPVPAAAADPLGAPRTVLEERRKPWLNTFGAPRFLRDGRRFVWVSERSGFAHLYLCDVSGSCRPMTQGRWMVDAQVSFANASAAVTLDERSGFVYFTATEKDPRERHLYRVRLDGTARARLTLEDGVHKTLVAPEGRFYADTWSDASSPPRVWVTSQDGSRRFDIGGDARPPLLDYERGSVEFVSLHAADGTVLHASLVKPADFDPRTRYPVVVTVYGGPHAQTVTNVWSHVSPLDHLLASHGFLVWSLDNRGSTGRGLAFESAVARELGRVELEDQLAGVAYLKGLPYVDAARIGITGWSYGGFMTLYAVTRAPDVFRAAVAGAPVTDWRHYDTIYTERYMGTPGSNAAGYEASSPVRTAGELTAELLILHGTADDNVHLASSIAFVDAVLKSGRACELRLFPGQKHAFTATEHQVARDRAILEHFRRTLLGR